MERDWKRAIVLILETGNKLAGPKASSPLRGRGDPIGFRDLRLAETVGLGVSSRLKQLCLFERRLPVNE